MKSYGKIDFGSVKGFKLERGTTFPTQGLEPGYMFWMTGGLLPGPYVWNGTGWLPFFDLVLPNGKHAYVEPVGQVLCSIEAQTLTFSATGSGRNMYLNAAGILSSTMGFVVPENCVVKRITSMFSAAVTGTTTVQLRKNKATTATYSQTIPANTTKYKADATSIQLVAGDEIAIYWAGTANVSTPIVNLELSWR